MRNIQETLLMTFCLASYHAKRLGAEADELPDLGWSGYVLHYKDEWQLQILSGGQSCVAGRPFLSSA